MAVRVAAAAAKAAAVAEVMGLEAPSTPSDTLDGRTVAMVAVRREVAGGTVWVARAREIRCSRSRIKKECTRGTLFDMRTENRLSHELLTHTHTHARAHKHARTHARMHCVVCAR